MHPESFKQTLSRLKKCDQVWNDMRPVEGGRHCAKCSKKIVDFSGMNHQEIAFFMAAQDGPVCGFYLPEQLPQYDTKRKLLPVALGLGTLMLTANASYAAKSAKSETYTYANNTENRDSSAQITPAIDADTVIIKGYVQGEGANKVIEILPGATVWIKDTKVGTVVRADGSFNLRYVPQIHNGEFTIVIAFIGFRRQEIKIMATSDNQIDLIDMGSVTLEQEKAIEYYVITKKTTKAGRLWRKMTKPFRRK